jgi:hypothetical protein
MNLKPIKDYEDLYSLDLNTNQIYSHYTKKFRKCFIIDGYYRVKLNKNKISKNIALHRIVYKAYNGTIPEGLCIDHIDNNRLNNHIDNLRLATLSENQYNRKSRTNTGYKNITLLKNGTYRIRIYKSKKNVYDKCFKTLEEAIENRDLKLKEFHNDFAKYD